MLNELRDTFSKARNFEKDNIVYSFGTDNI